MDIWDKPLSCKAKDCLVHAQQHYDACFIILEGILLREQLLSDGGRQIVGLYVKGDVCNLAALADGHADYDLIALSPVSYLPVRRHWLTSAARESVEVSQALWREMARETTMSAAWIVNLGRRQAYQRIGSFLCELEARLRAAGQGDADGFDWCGTQTDIGAVTGLSLVHVNRTLRKLDIDKLVSYGRHLRFHDVEKLRAAVEFDPAYLSLERESLADVLLSRLGEHETVRSERLSWVSSHDGHAP